MDVSQVRASLGLYNTDTSAPSDNGSFDAGDADHSPYADPISSFDANSAAKKLLDERFKSAIDLLDNKIGKSGIGRTATAVAGLYLVWASEYYSHEAAHNIEFQKGTGKSPSLDFYIWRHAVPEYAPTAGPEINETVNETVYVLALPDNTFVVLKTIFSSSFSSSFGTDRIIASILDGPNKDAINASNKWRENILGKNTFYGSLNFLSGKLSDALYLAYVGTKDVAVERNTDPMSIMCYYNGSQKEIDFRNDVDVYTMLLRNKGIDLTKSKYLTQILAADCLSFHTWESIYSVCSYVADGKTNDAVKIRINDSSITPPIINKYLTPNGSYFDASTIVEFGKMSPIEVSFGRDADFMGAGDVKWMRAGAKIYDLALNESIHISPYAYWNKDGRSNEEKISGGFDSSFNLSDEAIFKATLEYDQDDILENAIKRKPNGANFNCGLDISI
jgi:hypothetical protein